MYCGHCGAELKPGDKMCPKCGYLVLDTQQSSESLKGPSSVTASEIETSQKDAASVSPTEQTKKVQSATKFKLMLVIAMACFFFPFVTVSCMGDQVTASGVEVMTTVSLQDKYDFSELRVNIYLLVTAVLAVIGFITAKKGRPLTIPGVAATGATVALLLFRFRIYSFYGIESIKEGVAIDFRWGWWLSLLCFMDAVGVALASHSEPTNERNSIKPVAKGANQISIWGILGAVLIITVLLFLLLGKKTEPDDLIDADDWVAMNESNSPADSYKEGSDIMANDIIPIGELCRAYSSNPVAADKQYANQRLNVQGEIASITPSPFDDTVSVSLSYANTESLEDFTIFMAYFEFSASNEGLYDLEVGKTETLSGVLEPDGGGMFIHFSDATLYGQALPDNTEGGSTGVQDVSSGTESSITFDTEFYSLEFPDYWEDLSVYDQWDIDPYSYGITFYENQSLDDSDGDGGVLFSIALYSDEDYMDYPSYTYLGQLSVVRLATYDVVVIYPTDVQFSDAGQETYMKLSNDIDGILASFTPQPDVDCEYIPAN